MCDPQPGNLADDSAQDQFDVEGTELTMGYAAWLGRISPVSCSLVRLLEAAGAVVYVRTNVPQTLMIGDTDNHVFGRTWNPCDRTRSPGGSSGGEGALIALKGSILGVVRALALPFELWQLTIRSRSAHRAQTLGERRERVGTSTSFG